MSSASGLGFNRVASANLPEALEGIMTAGIVPVSMFRLRTLAVHETVTGHVEVGSNNHCRSSKHQYGVRQHQLALCEIRLELS